mgnify:CR=1 FL=1
MKESILQKFIRLFRDIDKEILPNANVLEFFVGKNKI